jgi:hypothetical protein
VPVVSAIGELNYNVQTKVVRTPPLDGQWQVGTYAQPVFWKRTGFQGWIVGHPEVGRKWASGESKSERSVAPAQRLGHVYR